MLFFLKDLVEKPQRHDGSKLGFLIFYEVQFTFKNISPLNNCSMPLRTSTNYPILQDNLMFGE